MSDEPKRLPNRYGLLLKALFLCAGAAILVFLVYKTISDTQQSAWEACILSTESELANLVRTSEIVRTSLRLDGQWRTLTSDERQSLIQFVKTSDRLDCPRYSSRESLIEFMRAKPMSAREVDGKIQIQIERWASVKDYH
jgi:hypothetical protein